MLQRERFGGQGPHRLDRAHCAPHAVLADKSPTCLATDGTKRHGCGSVVLSHPWVRLCRASRHPDSIGRAVRGSGQRDTSPGEPAASVPARIRPPSTMARDEIRRQTASESWINTKRQRPPGGAGIPRNWGLTRLPYMCIYRTPRCGGPAAGRMGLKTRQGRRQVERWRRLWLPGLQCRRKWQRLPRTCAASIVRARSKEG
jgi:hypothetical protein